MGVIGFLEERGLTREQLIESLGVEGQETLFVVGSPSAGAADDECDLEMVLLTSERGFRRRADMLAPEARAGGERRRLGVIYARIDQVDVEVSVHLTATYERLLDALEALDPWSAAGVVEAGDALGGMPREAAVELLHRLHGGRAITNRTAFDALRRRLDLRKLGAWNIHRSLLRGTDALVDARRSLCTADTENAYLKLSAAYDALGDAVLFARGEPIDRWRWRLPRLRALGPSAFLERYLDVMLVRRKPSEPLCDFVARQLDAAQGVAETLRRAQSLGPLYA
ncbi:MAG: hypothetical protein R3B70_08385 [Polyangiaceae bacterium]